MMLALCRGTPGAGLRPTPSEGIGIAYPSGAARIVDLPGESSDNGGISGWNGWPPCMPIR
jgi:hypothetical protein